MNNKDEISPTDKLVHLFGNIKSSTGKALQKTKEKVSTAKDQIVSAFVSERIEDTPSNVTGSTPPPPNLLDLELPSIPMSPESTPSSFLQDLSILNEPPPSPVVTTPIVHKEPEFCERLHLAINQLKLQVDMYQRLLNNNANQALLHHCHHLLLLAENAKSIDVIFNSSQKAKQAYFSDCYTWDPIEPSSSVESKEPESVQPPQQIKLSYIAVNNTVESLTISTSMDLAVFLREQRVIISEMNNLLGASPSTAIFQSFLTQSGLSWAPAYLKRIEDMTQQLDIACSELTYAIETTQLTTNIKQVAEMSYADCDVYFMDIPKKPQSNYRDCYIWDGRKLAYIPAVLPDDGTPFEEVPLNNPLLLSARFQGLTANLQPPVHMTLANHEYAELIHNNGGKNHTYHARTQHDTLLKQAKESLDNIKARWDLNNQTMIDIVLNKPIPNQPIESNVLYVYEENGQVQYTLRTTPRSQIIPFPHETPSIWHRFTSFWHPQAQVTSTHPNDTTLTGVLFSSDSNDNLKYQLINAINYRKILTIDTKNEIWNIFCQKNPSFAWTDYHLKNKDYLDTIANLTGQLATQNESLEHYRQDQNQNLQQRVDTEKEALRQKINDDEVFAWFTHENVPLQSGLALYQECQRLYDVSRPDDKRLLKGINKRIDERIEFGFKSKELPITELPGVLRRINSPVLPQTIQHTKRQANLSLMFLGVGLIAASIALFILSHGLSSQLSYAGITLGTHLLFNLSLAGLAGGAIVYAFGLFAGSKQVVATPALDEAHTQQASNRLY